MQERLKKLMRAEGLNSTRLAELLGIQASGISHIMSGRNKPSYDFLIKLLHRFPNLNPDWLLLDKGPMYREQIKGKTPDIAATGELFAAPRISDDKESTEPDNRDIIPTGLSPDISQLQTLSDADIDSIIICYRDKSCRIYKARN